MEQGPVFGRMASPSLDPLQPKETALSMAVPGDAMIRGESLLSLYETKSDWVLPLLAPPVVCEERQLDKSATNNQKKYNNKKLYMFKFSCSVTLLPSGVTIHPLLIASFWVYIGYVMWSTSGYLHHPLPVGSGYPVNLGHRLMSMVMRPPLW